MLRRFDSPFLAKRLCVPTIVPSLDEALEWCEKQSLSESGNSRTEPEPLSEALEAELGDAAIARIFLDHFAVVDVPPGTILMEQGDASDDLAFIERGRASVIIRFGDKPPMRVRTILAGTMVGELGFYIDTPRTATIRTETDCRILRITKADIRRLEETNPRISLELHRLLAKRLCRRIRDKDHLIAGLMRSMKRSVV
jgi:SulP family sulfate permease